MSMDWVSIFLSLGIFGVISAHVIDWIRKAYEEGRDKQNFLKSIKKELEDSHSLLKGEGHLLPTDLWKAGMFAGLLKLIPYENKISIAKIYFRIECHNYEAEKVRDVSILAATTKEKPKATIDARLREQPVRVKTPWTYAELLHNELTVRQRKEEKKLRKDINDLLKRNIWDC